MFPNVMLAYKSIRFYKIYYEIVSLNNQEIYPNYTKQKPTMSCTPTTKFHTWKNLRIFRFDCQRYRNIDGWFLQIHAKEAVWNLLRDVVYIIVMIKKNRCFKTINVSAIKMFIRWWSKFNKLMIECQNHIENHLKNSESFNFTI